VIKHLIRRIERLERSDEGLRRAAKRQAAPFSRGEPNGLLRDGNMNDLTEPVRRSLPAARVERPPRISRAEATSNRDRGSVKRVRAADRRQSERAESHSGTRTRYGHTCDSGQSDDGQGHPRHRRHATAGGFALYRQRAEVVLGAFLRAFLERSLKAPERQRGVAVEFPPQTLAAWLVLVFDHSTAIAARSRDARLSSASAVRS